MEALGKGIYLFGHTHIQWSFQSEGGDKILINPGSCGLPYTILEISDEQKVTVEERRVPFDKEAYIETFLQSDQCIEAKVWSQVIVKELRTNREHLSFFLQYVEKYATEIGDARRPFSVTTWEQAYEHWQNSL